MSELLPHLQFSSGDILHSTDSRFLQLVMNSGSRDGSSTVSLRNSAPKFPSSPSPFPATGTVLASTPTFHPRRCAKRVA